MHWKGGVLGSLTAILGWAIGHAAALSSLADGHSAVVSGIITVAGILATALAQPVGSPKTTVDPTAPAAK